MKKFGITGSLASGKTTTSKILSFKKGPLFSADTIVKNLYRKKEFKNIVSKKFKIQKKGNLKKILRNKILSNNLSLNKLENIIHPLVRREMNSFIKKNKRKKFIFFEIPLLIESKLMKKFDVIIYVKAKKSIRLKRFLSKGGNKKLFHLLNDKQLSDFKKVKFAQHIIVNNNNIKILKKRLLDILNNYE